MRLALAHRKVLMAADDSQSDDAIKETVKELLEKLMRQIDDRNCTAPLLVIVASAPCNRGPAAGPLQPPGPPEVATEDETILAVRLIQWWKASQAIQDRFGSVAIYAEYVDRMLAGESKWDSALIPSNEAGVN